MFPKNSAFHQDLGVEKHLSQIRQATLSNLSVSERDNPAAGKTQKSAAIHLLTAAELMLQEQKNDSVAGAVVELIREAKEALDADAS